MRAVITLAGEGTRMLPVTLGLRKELLPLFYRGGNGVPVLAPVSDLVVRSLYAAGVRRMTMVVGRDVQGMLRYFTPDHAFLRRHARHTERLVEALALHRMLARLHFTWVVQSHPRGFGHALLAAEATLGGEPFLLHAGDAVLLERGNGPVLRKMAGLLEREAASAVLCVRRVANPRHYGVVEGKIGGRWEGRPYLEVRGMEEKPTRPRSTWAATAMYAFRKDIFRAIREGTRGRKGELEVTTGISRLVSEGYRVLALICRPPAEEWISVGSPEGYFKALQTSYTAALRCAP